MNSDNINNLIIGVIVLALIGDFLALFCELSSQRNEKRAEREQEEKERKVNLELDNLRKRVALLEEQVSILQ
jgi:hypothetical protein